MAVTLPALVIVILFMAAMAMVYARGRNGRAKGARGDEPRLTGPCAHCDVSIRGNCKVPKQRV